MNKDVFDQGWQRERDRLAGIESLFDSHSKQRLAELGVSDGWHTAWRWGSGREVSRQGRRSRPPVADGAQPAVGSPRQPLGCIIKLIPLASGPMTEPTVARLAWRPGGGRWR